MSPSTPVRRITTWWPLIVGAVVLALAAGAVGGVLYKELSDKPGSCDAQRLAVKVQPSLVALLGTDGTTVGNGAIIRADGIVLTNSHLLNGAQRGATVPVLLPSGERLDAAVLADDAGSDLALLDLQREQLPALPLSWNQEIKAGEPVTIFTSPLTPSGWISDGIVAEQNHTVSFDLPAGRSGALIDAMVISPQPPTTTSGGVVTNCDGQVIGLATAVPTVADTDNSPTQTVVLPATMVWRISQELLSSTAATHPWLGAWVAPVSADIAARYKTTAGLYVQAATAGQPAAQAGLTGGDIITMIDGQPATSTSWSRMLMNTDIGASVTLSYVRGDREYSASVVVAERGASR